MLNLAKKAIDWLRDGYTMLRYRDAVSHTWDKEHEWLMFEALEHGKCETYEEAMQDVLHHGGSLEVFDYLPKRYRDKTLREVTSATFGKEVRRKKRRQENTKTRQKKLAETHTDILDVGL